MNRIGKQAGGDPRSRISGRGEPRVDCVHVRRCNGNEPALVQDPLLEVREIKRAVVDNRAAEARPVLRLRKRKLALRQQRIVCGEPLIAQIAVEIPVESIGPALGDHIDVAAQCAAQLGLTAGGYHLKLVHDVQTVENTAQPGGVVVSRKTVDDKVIREIALAPDRDALPRDRRCLGEELIAGGVGRRHTGNHEREIQKITPVERQCADLGLRYRSRDLAPRRLQHGRLAAHDDIGLGRSDRERDRQLIGRPQREGQRSRRVGESLMAHSDLVRTDPEVGESKSPLPVRGRRAGQISIDLTRRNSRAFDDCARWIRHTTTDARIINRLLRARDRAEYP